MAVFDSVVASTLIREEKGIQRLVYYVTHILLGAEVNYPIMEKLVFALIIIARWVQPYFQAYTIRIVMNQPLENYWIFLKS